MRTFSLDLRERILASYDKEEGTRDRDRGIATGSPWAWSKSSCSSVGAPATSAPRHHRSGRKPIILASASRQLRALLGKKPDLTLNELRAAVALDCSLPAIHYALEKMGLTYKKRHSAPASKTARTSRGRAGRGGGGRPASTRRG